MTSQVYRKYLWHNIQDCTGSLRHQIFAVLAPARVLCCALRRHFERRWVSSLINDGENACAKQPHVPLKISGQLVSYMAAAGRKSCGSVIQQGCVETLGHLWTAQAWNLVEKAIYPPCHLLICKGAGRSTVDTIVCGWWLMVRLDVNWFWLRNCWVQASQAGSMLIEIENQTGLGMLRAVLRFKYPSHHCSFCSHFHQ